MYFLNVVELVRKKLSIFLEESVVLQPFKKEINMKKTLPRIIAVHTRLGKKKILRNGTLVAFKADDGVVRIGYSKCNMYKDRFDRGVGYSTAFGRACSLLYDPKIVAHLKLPFTLEDDMKSFIGKACAFFKTNKVEVVGMNQEVVNTYIKDWKAAKPKHKLEAV